MKNVILNSKGEVLKLTPTEQAIANSLQLELRNPKYAAINNDLGFEINITSLTQIVKEISEQKFYTVPFAEYMPVVIGNGAWSSNLVTYRDFQMAGDFENGVIDTASDNAKLASVSSGVDSITVPVINWAMQTGWSLFDLKQAARSGNWDLVSSREKARKRRWDLGLQDIAFVGMKSNTAIRGLLNQTNVTSNTSLITQYISTMNATQMQALVAGILGAYRSNSQFTAYPTHFIIPELDYNGLCVPYVGTVGTYPVPTLEYLLSMFRTLTRNPNFQILPSAYCDEVNNTPYVGLGKNRYVLLNKESESLRMDIPVDYTSTLQNTINGFQFQSVGYGQFTGVKAYREREMLYFDFTV